MSENISLEMPLRESCDVLSKFKTIGDLRNAYPNLRFVKYMYIDPNDNRLKGTNPANNLLLVKDSYITVNGPLNDIHKFTIAASPK
ncbi:hypothetical protein HYS31_04665 [Candidatus Woesearchaeota archaeon]|nr:hypothetical protein [Candidatus Woesearchaeota archaeon]